MAISQYLELTIGPAVVQAAGYKTPYAQTVQAMRGTVPVSVQCLSAGVAANLPTGAVLFYGLKLPAAMKGAWLALAQLAAVDTVNSPGLWTGSLALNNPTLRAAQHADVDDPDPELDPLTCVAEIYYTLPPVNGTPTDPVGSVKFTFAVGAPLFDDSTDIAPAPRAPGDRPIDLFGVTQRTSATAGDPTALVNVPTVGFTAGQLYSFTEASTSLLTFFRLVAGTAAAGNADQVQPADYNAQTNAVFFRHEPTGAPAGASFTLNDVATNTAKLALPANTAAGYQVLITGEGNRIEQFLGGDITQDANWLVLRNTVELIVHNENADDITVDGVNVPGEVPTNIGWVALPYLSCSAGNNNMFIRSLSFTSIDGTIINLPTFINSFTGNAQVYMGHEFPDRQSGVTFHLFENNG